MNPSALTREELGHYAPIDAEVAAYLVEHAPRLFEEAEDVYDPAGCYDDGYEEGGGAKLRKLAELYNEQLREWLDKVPDMSLAGDGNLEELETLLGAIEAEFADD